MPRPRKESRLHLIPNSGFLLRCCSFLLFASISILGTWRQRNCRLETSKLRWSIICCRNRSWRMNCRALSSLVRSMSTRRTSASPSPRSAKDSALPFLTYSLSYWRRRLKRYSCVCLSVYFCLCLMSLSVCLSLSISASLSLSVCLVSFLSVSGCLCLSESISVYLCLCLSHVSVCLSLSISVYLCLSVSVSVCLSRVFLICVWLSLSVSAYLCLSLSISVCLSCFFLICVWLSVSVLVYLPVLLSIHQSVLYLQLPTQQLLPYLNFFQWFCNILI